MGATTEFFRKEEVGRVLVRNLGEIRLEISVLSPEFVRLIHHRFWVALCAPRFPGRLQLPTEIELLLPFHYSPPSILCICLSESK